MQLGRDFLQQQQTDTRSWCRGFALFVAAAVDPAEKPTRVFMERPSFLFTKGTDDRQKARQSLSAVGRDKLCQTCLLQLCLCVVSFQLTAS